MQTTCMVTNFSLSELVVTSFLVKIGAAHVNTRKSDSVLSLYRRSIISSLEHPLSLEISGGMEIESKRF